MKLIRAALISIGIGILLSLITYACATPITDLYIQQHRDGTLLPGDPNLAAWRAHTSERSITFDHIIERDSQRTVAIFREKGLWDGRPEEAAGVMMIHSDGGKIVGTEWARVDPEALPSNMAASGQWADIGSTAIGLSTGFEEGNPLGVVALPLKLVLYNSAKTGSLGDCIGMRQALATTGWGAAAANIATVAGLFPFSLIVGLVAGIGVHEHSRDDAVLECSR